MCITRVRILILNICASCPALQLFIEYMDVVSQFVSDLLFFGTLLAKMLRNTHDVISMLVSNRALPANSADSRARSQNMYDSQRSQSLKSRANSDARTHGDREDGSKEVKLLQNKRPRSEITHPRAHEYFIPSTYPESTQFYSSEGRPSLSYPNTLHEEPSLNRSKSLVHPQVTIPVHKNHSSTEISPVHNTPDWQSTLRTSRPATDYIPETQFQFEGNGYESGSLISGKDHVTYGQHPNYRTSAESSVPAGSHRIQGSMHIDQVSNDYSRHSQSDMRAQNMALVKMHATNAVRQPRGVSTRFRGNEVPFEPHAHELKVSECGMASGPSEAIRAADLHSTYSTLRETTNFPRVSDYHDRVSPSPSYPVSDALREGSVLYTKLLDISVFQDDPRSKLHHNSNIRGSREKESRSERRIVQVRHVQRQGEHVTVVVEVMDQVTTPYNISKTPRKTDKPSEEGHILSPSGRLLTLRVKDLDLGENAMYENRNREPSFLPTVVPLSEVHSVYVV